VTLRARWVTLRGSLGDAYRPPAWQVVYRHASELMEIACPSARINPEDGEQQQLGAGMDDEKTLLTPDVSRTLLTALRRREGMIAEAVEAGGSCPGTQYLSRATQQGCWEI
jgi:hypothetical protein